MANGLSSAIATPFSRFLLALEHKDFLTLWTANLCAGSAAWALIVSRAVLTKDLTEFSDFNLFLFGFNITSLYMWVGLVTFAAMIPRVFSTVITGFLADRFDRQTVLQWTYTLNLAHNILLAILVMVGLVNIWWLVGLSLLNGTLRSAQMTTTQSLVPNLVPRGVLPNAVALNEATQQGSRFLGRRGGLAHYPLFRFGARLLGLRPSLRYWTGAGGPHRDPFHRQDGCPPGILGKSRCRVRVRLLPTAGAGHGFDCPGPLFTGHVLRVSAAAGGRRQTEHRWREGAGFLIMGVGIGALATAVWLAGIRSEKTRGTLFLLFGFASGLGPLVLALSANPMLSLGATIVIGMSQGGFMTITHTIIQSIIDDSVRGRVSGVYSFHVGGSMAFANFINAGLIDVGTFIPPPLRA